MGLKHVQDLYDAFFRLLWSWELWILLGVGVIRDLFFFRDSPSCFISSHLVPHALGHTRILSHTLLRSFPFLDSPTLGKNGVF